MNTARILIVEDDAQLVTLLEKMLTQSGYQIAGRAATGELAIAAALTQKPDAILMDTQLNGTMMGIQIAEEIQRQIDIPIIYLAAEDDEEILQQVKQRDAYIYLAKPVRERELRASLEMALYKQATERRLQRLGQILRAMREINQLVTHEHDAQRLMDQACQILLSAHGYRFVWVGQSMGDRLKPIAHAGDGQKVLQSIAGSATHEQGMKLPGTEAARNRRVVVCHDMLHDERYAPWREELEQVHFRSTVAVPIFHEESLFGVLSVYSDQTNIFGAEEMDLLLELTSDIAFGLKAIDGETERKRTEEALRASEEKYRTVADFAYAWEAWHAPDGTFLYVSPSCQRITGRSAAEFMADASLTVRITHPDDQSQIISHYHEITQPNNNQNYEFDYRIILPNGETRWVNHSCTAVYNGERWLGRRESNHDITERKQAERNIYESEERFSTIFHASPIPILIIRMDDGKFTDANEAFQNLSGYSREEVMEHSPFELNQWVYPDDLRRLEMMVRQKGIVHDFETKLRSKSGVIHEVLMSTAPIVVGGKRYVVNLAYDITTRKQHEIELLTIAKLSAALRTAPSRAEMLPVIVEQLVTLLNCETVSIEITDPLTGDAVTEAAYGSWEALIGTRQKCGTGINNIISQTRQAYSTNDLQNDPNLAYPEWTINEIHGGIGAPLIAQNQLIGFAWMGRKSEIAEAEIRLFTAAADIAANAIYRATLHEQSQKDAADLILAYDSTLEGWAHALELRDQETEGHTRRVMQMTVDLARNMGVGKNELENVRRGALLHDIGKMGIPDSVLLKPGTLNDYEWEIMRRHPEYAYQFLEPIEYLHPALDIPYCHHEKWDGSGYPRGLKGTQIPFIARIFAIVDVWDALRSDRPYRAAWNPETTRKYIIDQSGIHFDPQVVHMFLELIDSNNDDDAQDNHKFPGIT